MRASHLCAYVIAIEVSSVVVARNRPMTWRRFSRQPASRRAVIADVFERQRGIAAYRRRQTSEESEAMRVEAGGLPLSRE